MLSLYNGPDVPKPLCFGDFDDDGDCDHCHCRLSCMRKKVEDEKGGTCSFIKE